MNSKKEPTLEELGLDQPAEKSKFGKALDGYQAPPEEFSKTWVDSIKSPPTMAGNCGLAAVLSFFIPGAGQVYRGRILTGFFSFLAIGFLYGVSLAFWPVFLLAIPLHLANVSLAYSN